MSNWPVDDLRGKIHIKHGFPFKGEFFSDQKSEYIVLTPGNFYEEGGFKRQPGKEKFYTGEIPEEYLHQKGDLIVAMTEQAAGLLGSCARVPESGLYLHNQRLGLITTDPQVLHKDYVYYLFRTRAVREQIRLTSSGSKVKHTSPERIYNVRVPIPDIKKQQKIVDFLDLLENKIALNNRINAELEAMAKTLYDYWFVQFDFPDANGKPYKTSGGKMEYNATLKREIPAGWNSCKLSEFIKLEYGKPLKSEYRTGSGYPVFGSSGIVGFHVDYLVEGPGLIIGRKGTVGKVNYSFENFYPIDTAYYVTCKKITSMIFLNYLINSLGLESMNSDSAVPGLNREATLGISIVSAPLELISKYHEYAESWFEKKKIIVEENNALIKLRDWLLPMLMNGQVTVR